MNLNRIKGYMRTWGRNENGNIISLYYNFKKDKYETDPLFELTLEDM